MARIAINGLGRIGRAMLKLMHRHPRFDVVGLNDIAAADNLAYLLRYDTVYGRFPGEVEGEDGALVVDGTSYPLFDEKDPAKLPWKDLGVDVVFECTGVFTKGEDLAKHVKAGAGAVILSAPAKSEDVPTIVHGANRFERGGGDALSCASCTTNCITPVVEIVGRRIGLRKATMTTIHAYTASQAIIDQPAKKFRRGRAGAASFVPSSTGAAVATTKALPQYRGKFDGVAVRGPVPVGSLADIVCLTERDTSVEEVNSIFSEEAAGERYRDVLAVTEDPIVSADIIQEPFASIVDLGLTQVVDGDLVKVMSWYDNEWGYACQMVREAESLVAEG